MKVEDIYGQVFKIKCSNIMYREQRNRGEQIPMIKKFFTGGCVFIAIIAFLIIPLLLFSTASPASTQNAVLTAQLTVTIQNIYDFGSLELMTLSNYRFDNSITSPPRELRSFFDASSQVSQNLYFESDADSVFTVPTVLRDRVSEILGCTNGTANLSDTDCANQLRGTQIMMAYSYTREGPTDNNPIPGEVFLNEHDLTRQQAAELAQVLNASNQDITSFVCPSNYSRWVRLPAQGKVTTYPIAANPKHSVTMTLVTDEQESYWSLVDSSVSTQSAAEGLSFVLISDNFVLSSLLSLTGVSSYSVIGFYAIVVYSFAQLLRLLYGDQVKEIIFQDLQNVDYILRIVIAVKLARNQRNYHLEELLYRKLIRIYRDPALIVELSKRKDDVKSNKLAFDGFTDTTYNDPTSFGYGIRNRRDVILRRRQAETADDEEQNSPPIQSNIK